MSDSDTTLPVIPSGDGFDNGESHDRILQGDLLKFNDGRWSHKDGTPVRPGIKLLAMSTTKVIQHWKDRMPIETITAQPLPDVNELNATIPEDEWEKNDDGDPRPPYVKQYIVYFLDPVDASIYTHINSTIGLRIAIEKLKERVVWMRRLRGERVTPLVELSTKPMKTKRGTKIRPDFPILEWRDLGAGLEANPAVPALGKPVTEPTLAEEMNESLDNI